MIIRKKDTTSDGFRAWRRFEFSRVTILATVLVIVYCFGSLPSGFCQTDNVEDNNNSTILNDDEFLNETDAPTISMDDMNMTLSPDDNDTNITQSPSEAAQEDQGRPQTATQSPDKDSELRCETWNIYTEQDCIAACNGFPYTLLYQSRPIKNATGLIKEAYSGFLCQCLQAIPPVDCEYFYTFPACTEVGVYDCSLIAPSTSSQISKSQDNRSVRNATNTSSVVNENNADKNDTIANTSSTSHNNNSTDTSNNTIIKQITCGEYCRDLGFIEVTTDNNNNAYDHLCTRNIKVKPKWTSCACQVEFDFENDRSVTITKGKYVCGDPGYTMGLNFDIDDTSTAYSMLMPDRRTTTITTMMTIMAGFLVVIG